MTKTNAQMVATIEAAITSSGLRENTGARVRQAALDMLAREGQPGGVASLDSSGRLEQAGSTDVVVSDVAAACALTNLREGMTIRVAGDLFVVVNDATLGSDGGTVFIPNSELSDQVSEAIPAGTFTTNPDEVAAEYTLDHTSIDLESVQCVLTNGGETITGWQLHGHVLSVVTAVREATPQLPFIDTANGKFRDPLARLTVFSTRTGGMLLRYKYATSGLRLKRVTGSRFDLRWWPVTATVDESGTQIDNTDYICWANNAAALADADELYFHDIYHYSHAIEQPDGVAWVGRNAYVSGLRVMDGEGYSELLLSKSSAPNPAVHPGDSAATVWFQYQHYFSAYTPTVSAATGARRLTLEDISLDGNADNNLDFWTDPELYAGAYVSANGYFHNAPFYTAYSVSNHSARVIPEGQKLFLRGHVRMLGYGGCGIIGNDANRVVQTGLFEVGNCMHNHWLYRADGEYENLHGIGYAWGDAIRAANMVIKNLVLTPTRHQDTRYDYVSVLNYDAQSANFTTGQTLTGGTSGATAVITDQIDSGSTGKLFLKALTGTFQDNETITDGAGGSATANGVVVANSTYSPYENINVVSFVYPGFPQINFGQTGHPLALPVHQFICDNLYMDLSAMDSVASGHTFQRAQPFILGSDNFQIRSGRLRGYREPVNLSVYLTYGNGFQYGPFRNIYSNFSVETPSRSGVSLFASNSNDGAFHNATFVHPIEALAATPVPENPAPSGAGFILGNLRFSQAVDAYDGWGIDFSGATALGLSGDYIDITCPDSGNPVFRVWFDYNSASTPPSGSGVTLIEVDIAIAASTDTIAQAAATAIRANAAAFAKITAFSHPVRTPEKLVVGSHTLYRSYPAASGILTVDVTNATGVTKAQRAQQRFYEKSTVNFEDSDWSMPVSAGLWNMPDALGADRDVTLNFRRCVVGAATLPYLLCGSLGALDDVTPAVLDKVHLNFEDCIIHFRGTVTGIFAAYANLDFLLYASKLRNCRIITDDATYGELKSEDYGEYSWVANGSDTSIDIPTKLGWGPKVFRVDPADAATMAVWTASDAFVTYRRNGGTALGGTGAYYQGPDGATNEDRRAPVLRVTFSAAPAAATYKFRWHGAISP